MAQLNDGSLLEKLLKSNYPLTNYLYRQQQFIKIYSTTQNTAVPTPGLNSTAESEIIPAQKRKTPLPPSPCFNVLDTLDFNVPDTLDFNASD